MRKADRFPRYWLLTLLALAMLVNTGCGGGGGGGPVTGSTVTANDGVPVAAIAGVVVADPALSAPSLAPLRSVSRATGVPSVAVSVYSGGVRVAAFDSVTTDADGFFLIPLYSVKHAAFLNAGTALEIRLSSVFSITGSRNSVRVTPTLNQTVFSNIYLANNEVRAAIQRQIPTASVPVAPNTLQLIKEQQLAAVNTSGSPGSVEGLLDVPLAQAVLTLDGLTVPASPAQPGGLYFEAVTSPVAERYGYRINNVTPGSHAVAAQLTSGQTVLPALQVVVGAGLPTRGVDFGFNLVSPDLVLQKVSGDLQTGTVATQLTQPLKVRVLRNGAAASGQGVTFRVISGSAALSNLTTNTDSNGEARINVLLGNVAGTLQIMAFLTDYSGQSVTFTVQVVPAMDPLGRPTAVLERAEASQKALVLRYSELVSGADLVSNYRVSVNSQPFVVLPGDTQLSYNAQLNESTLVFPSTFSLPAGATVQLALFNIQDIAGNPTDPATDYRTNLLTVEDNQAPTAVIASAQASTDYVVIQYSEDVAGADLINAYLISRNDGAYVPLVAPATAVYNSDTRRTRLSLTGMAGLDLQNNDRIIVKIKGVSDRAGNALGTADGYATVSFNVSEGDITRPFANIISADDYSNQIIIEYSEDVNANSAGAIGNYQLVQGITQQLNPSLGSVSYEPSNFRAILQLSSLQLAAGQTISVRILNMQDLAGNSPFPDTTLAYQTNDFTVTDLKPPTAQISAARDSDQTVVLDFSEAVSSFNPINLDLSLDGGSTWRTLSSSILATFSYDPAAAKLTLVFNSSLVIAGGQLLRLRLNYLTDLAGNSTSPNVGYLTNVFTVTESVTDPPTATISDATDHDQKVYVQFSKRITLAAATDRNNWMVSRDNGSTWIPLSTKPTASIAYAEATQIATIHYPEFGFTGGDVLKVLASNMVDTAGRPTVPAQNYEIGPFTARDSTPPSATIVSAYVPGQVIVVQFSEAMAGLSGVSALGENLRISLSSSDAYNVFFHSDSYDDASRRLTVSLTGASNPLFGTDDQLSLQFNGITDLAGNSGSDGLIRTARVKPAEVSAPYATIISARDFQQELILQFSKAMDTTTVSVPTNYYVQKNSNGFVRLSASSTFIYDPATYRLQILIKDGIQFQAGDLITVKTDNLRDGTGDQLATIPATGYITESFAATDTTPPRATIVAATDHDRKLTVEWNEPVLNANVLSNYEYSRDDGQTWSALSGATTLTSTDTQSVLVIESEKSFLGGDLIRLRISNVTDAGGSATVPAQNYEIGPFTAQDTTVPTFTPVQALDAADYSVVVQASEALDPDTVSDLASYAWIRPAMSELSLANSAVQYDSTTRLITVLLDPSILGDTSVTFAAGASVTLRIKGLKDLAGNTHSTHDYSFTVVDGRAPDVDNTAVTARDSDGIVTLPFTEALMEPTPGQFSVTVNGAARTINGIDWQSSSPSTVKLLLGSLTLGHEVIVTMNNIRDASGNYTVPRTGKTATVTVTAGVTAPSAVISSAGDASQIVKLTFDYRVVVRVGTSLYEPQHAGSQKYFYISKDNGVTWYQLDDALNPNPDPLPSGVTARVAATIAREADFKTYQFSFTGFSFQAGDYLRMKMDYIVYDLTYGVPLVYAPTVPPTGYQTAAFIATDTTPPSAQIISAKLSNQTIQLQWNESVTGAGGSPGLFYNISNFYLSYDGGTTFVLLTSLIADNFMYLENSGRITQIEMGSTLPFAATDSLVVKAFGVKDLAGNEVASTGFVSAPYSPDDDVKPTATIVSAGDGDVLPDDPDYVQLIKIKFSEPVWTTAAGNKYNYLVSVDNGVTYQPLINSTVTTIQPDGFNFSATEFAELYIRDASLLYTVGTQIYVQVSNVTDLKGNPTNPATGYTLTRAVDDTKRPTITSITAKDLAGVGQNGDTITIQWSESVKNAELISNYKLFVNAVQVSLAGAYLNYNDSNKQTHLVLDAASAFAESDSIYLEISNVVDVNDNNLNTGLPNVYTTSPLTVTDNVSPTVWIEEAKDSYADPAKTYRNIKLRWSESVNSVAATNPANWTVKKNNGSHTLLSTISAAVPVHEVDAVNGDRTTLRISDALFPFQGGDVLEVKVSNVSDSSGNSLNPNPYTTPIFQAEDWTLPTAAIASATDGNQRLVIKFSEAIRALDPSKDVVSNDDGLDLFLSKDAGVTWVQVRNHPTLSTFVYNPTNYELTVTIGGADTGIFSFESGDALRIKIARFQDMSENAWGDNSALPSGGRPYFFDFIASSDFTAIEDTNPPTVVLPATAGDSDVLRITFSEAMDATTVEDETHYKIAQEGPLAVTPSAYTPQTAATATATWNAVGKYVDLQLSSMDLVGGNQVWIELSNVKDAAGNLIVTTIIGPIVVADSAPPQISAVELTGIGLLVSFSEAMNTAAVAGAGGNPASIRDTRNYELALASGTLPGEGDLQTLDSVIWSSTAPSDTQIVDSTKVLITNSGNWRFNYGDNFLIRISNVQDANGVAIVTATATGVVDSQVSLFTGSPGTSGVTSVSTAPGDSARLNQPYLLGPFIVGAVNNLARFFVVNQGDNRIYLCDPAGNTVNPMLGTWPGLNPPLLLSQAIYVQDIASSGLNQFFISDASADRISRSAAGYNVEMWFNNGEGSNNGGVGFARFDGPRGMAASADKNYIYVADANNHKIRRIDLSAGDVALATVTDYAGDGTAGYTDDQPALARFDSPTGLCVSTAGDVYVADTANNVIRVIYNGGNVDTYAGVGAAAFADGHRLSAAFSAPRGLAIDEENGFIYVADSGNNRVRRIDMTTDQVTTVAGGQFGDASTSRIAGKNVRFRTPSGLAWLGSLKQLFVTDTGNHVILKIEP